jgi:hypothetical protein
MSAEVFVALAILGGIIFWAMAALSAVALILVFIIARAIVRYFRR